jgi:uncharacterized protein YecE (DUF72 family)
VEVTADAGRVLVGTAGWADADLLASGWYPAQVRTAAERLAYYAQQFPLVEVNSSYYAIPSAANVRNWAQAPHDLTLNIKAYRLLTGQPTPTASLPTQLRPLAHGSWFAHGRVPDTLLERAWEVFKSNLEPLVSADRLGLVLLQFPASVIPDGNGIAQVQRALELCHPLPAAVEWRHAAWLAPQQREASFDLLRRHDAAFVCVDMPDHSPTAMPATLEVTAPTAVVRMHGRSPQWLTGDKRERYRYDYTPAELETWATRADWLAQRADQVHMILNTCCAGAAQRTATQLQAAVTNSASGLTSGLRRAG